VFLGFLRSGVKSRFEQQFSELADLPADSTRRVVYGMGMEGLACACRDIGFADNVFSLLLWHLHGSGILAMFSLNPKHKEALSYYQSIDADQADSDNAIATRCSARQSSRLTADHTDAPFAQIGVVACTSGIASNNGLTLSI
jgi:hypothetical protein